MRDLLAEPGGRLRADRIVVIPLTCDLRGERSTWRITLARRLQQVLRGQEMPGDHGTQLFDAMAVQSGKPLGTVAPFDLDAQHPLRRTGIASLMFLCASPDQPAQKDEIAESARQLVRRARAEARRISATQVAIPRIPFKLDSSDGSRDRGAVLFWQTALAEAAAGLQPGDPLDVLFGLYALGDGGKRNRDAFTGAVRESLPAGEPPLSPFRSGLALGLSCFAAGCLAAWICHRRPTPGYLAGLAALAATGAAGLLATFGLGNLGGAGLSPMQGFSVGLVLMIGIGTFAERAATFDWRKLLETGR
ncbi:MAG: hypothetical protein ABW023_01735 [Sphingomonas sp.]